jgi:hypothetical protein
MQRILNIARDMKLMLESKGGKRIFSVVSMIWQSPLIHIVTPTKGYVTSHVTYTMGAH